MDSELELQSAKDAERNRLGWDEADALAVRRTRVVCLGGGTGLPAVLRGLAARKPKPDTGERGVELTAVVAMSDDGGSSGRLRRARGILPPGDVRNCLLALADESGPLAEIFNYRFGGKKGLAGHAVGNLVIAALAEKKGDFLEAVKAAGSILRTRGKVFPCTTRPVSLAAELDDGTRLWGERAIGQAHRRIQRVSLVPRDPPAAPGLLDAIRRADLITLGPGSLYTSILPNLLVDGVADALRRSRAMKVLIGNLMTQPGETDGLDAVAHVRAIVEHVGPVVDAMLVNATRPPGEALERYAKQGAEVVTVDRRGLLGLGVVPVLADLLRPGTCVRHDGKKLARCLLTLAHTGL